MYPYGYGYYFDPTYILIIIGVIITMIASSKMNSRFEDIQESVVIAD